MTIYLDVVFIENFIMNLSIILSEAILLNLLDNFIKKIFAVLCATVYYVFTLLFPVTSCFQIIIAVLVIIIAFAPKNFKTLCVEFFLFYFINFVFAGISFALMCACNNGKFSVFNGVIIGNFDVFKVFLSGVIAISMLVYFFKRKTTHIFKDVIVSIYGKSKEIRLLFDSGNLLKEPYTGKPVIIVEKRALKTLLDEKVFNNLEKILSGTENIPEGMFIIPYRSLGNLSGFLLGIKPDFVTLKKSNRKIYDVVIGICNENISDTESYSGIFGLKTLDEGVCEL